MKFLHTYNESLRDQMKPKSREDIMSSLKGDPNSTFKSVNRTIGGTWFMDTVKTDYYKLVELFGEPKEKDWIGNNYLWTLQNEHGRILSIYDNGTNYDEDEIKEIDFDWRIGGSVPSDADDLIAYIYNKTIQ